MKSPFLYRAAATTFVLLASVMLVQVITVAFKSNRAPIIANPAGLSRRLPMHDTSSLITVLPPVTIVGTRPSLAEQRELVQHHGQPTAIAVLDENASRVGSSL